MKSMRQMQNEMLAKARFDGGYPRAVLMIGGVVALAKDEQEFNRLLQENDFLIGCVSAAAVVITVAFLCGMLWLFWPFT